MGFKDKLAKLRDDIHQQHPDLKIIYRAADVGKFEEVDAAVESSVQELGGIDILINNVCSSNRQVDKLLTSG